MAPSHDALRWRVGRKGGLGKATHRLLVVVVLYGPRSVGELAVLVGANNRQIRRLATKLAALGLIPNGERPEFVPDVAHRVDMLAFRLRARGIGERQRREHQQEREEYRDGYARRVHAYRRAQKKNRGKRRHRQTPTAPPEESLA